MGVWEKKDLHLGDDTARGPGEQHCLCKLLVTLGGPHERVKRSMQTQQQSLVAGNSGKAPRGVVNKSSERHWPKTEKKESLDDG